MRTTIAALLTLTACGGKNAYQTGEQAQLEFQLTAPSLVLETVRPIALGAETTLWVSWPDLPNEREHHIVDVKSADDALVPSGSTAMTVQICPSRSEVLEQCFYDLGARVSFSLQPTRVESARVAFEQNDKPLDAITLDVREPKTLDVDVTDMLGQPAPSPKVGDVLEVHFRLRDESGVELAATEGFSITDALGPIESPEPGRFEISSAQAGDAAFTAHFGKLTRDFTVTFAQ